MVLSRPATILVGIAAILPILYIPFFVAFAFLPAWQGGGPESMAAFDHIFTIHICVMLLSMTLIAFFIVYLFKTSRVPPEKKALWAVVIFMANMFSMPVFWYLYMWKQSDSRSSPSAPDE
jgi:hypothetical protein